MPNHSKFARREKEAESRYRFVHGRLRDHAESIAFFGGGDREKAIADSCFNDAHKAVLDQKASESRYKFLHSLIARDPEEYSRMLTLPMLLQAWLQLRLSQGSGQAQMGDMAHAATYADLVIERTTVAFSQLANVVQDISKLRAAAARVTGLVAVLEELDDSVGTADVEAPSDSILFQGVDLVTPTGVCLARSINFELPKGSSMMVTGPNSSGKTSLFRLLAGLWQPRGGRIRHPEGVMLVPQRAYSVSGTLLDQVTYPTQHRPPSAEVEARALKALESVNVAYLVEREGWGSQRKWEDVLSLGEQQRVGLSRLFFHRPAVGVLDECTSAVSVDVEERMLTALHAAGICCITMSQRLALEHLHEYELQIGAPNSEAWDFRRIEAAGWS